MIASCLIEQHNSLPGRGQFLLQIWSSRCRRSLAALNQGWYGQASVHQWRRISGFVAAFVGLLGTRSTVVLVLSVLGMVVESPRAQRKV